MSENAITYAEAMSELDVIVKDMQNDAIDVDHLTEKVRRASTLINFCKSKLKNTENAVNDILKDMEETALGN